MFVLEPGEPIAAIAESIYLYTLAEPMGIVVVDVDAFEAISVQEIMRLFTELPRIERFVHPQFCGRLEVRNATWALRTAVRAVHNGLVLRSAPGATLEFAA